MHVHALALLTFLISPTFWHDIWQQTPTRVIALAGSISALVQLVKKAAPNAISGKWTVAVNLALSVIAVFAGMKPANFWSQTTLSQLIVIFVAAGGIHGIAKAFRPQTDPAAGGNAGTANGNLGAKIAQPMILFVLLAGLATLCGCAAKNTVTVLPAGAINSTDANANRTLQTIHAFMANTTADIQAGKIQLNTAQLQALAKVDIALNTASLAEQAYHGGTGDAASLNTSVTAAQTAFQSAQAALAAATPK